MAPTNPLSSCFCSSALTDSSYPYGVSLRGALDRHPQLKDDLKVDLDLWLKNTRQLGGKLAPKDLFEQLANDRIVLLLNVLKPVAKLFCESNKSGISWKYLCSSWISEIFGQLLCSVVAQAQSLPASTNSYETLTDITKDVDLTMFAKLVFGIFESKRKGLSNNSTGFYVRQGIYFFFCKGAGVDSETAIANIDQIDHTCEELAKTEDATNKRNRLVAFAVLLGLGGTIDRLIPGNLDPAVLNVLIDCTSIIETCRVMKRLGLTRPGHTNTSHLQRNEAFKVELENQLDELELELKTTKLNHNNNLYNVGKGL